MADIIDLILRDHTWFREQFAELDTLRASKDPDLDAIGAVWDALATKLDLHADIEEEIFYPELLRLGQDDPKEETLDAIGDHNDIRDAIHEASKHKVGSEGWWKAVEQCRSANTEHMGEEEDEGLADFRRHATLEDRDELGLRFEAAKTAPVAPTLSREDTDPETYVEEHSEDG
jgi:iron-sulfur cluster repair protein YtfE (RIC family)